MISDELIAKIGTALDALPPEPTSRRELQTMISRLAANIRAAQARGATYVEIAKQISASGYPIKRSTLCAALIRHRKNEGSVRPAGRRSSPKSPRPPGEPQR